MSGILGLSLFHIYASDKIVTCVQINDLFELVRIIIDCFFLSENDNFTIKKDKKKSIHFKNPAALLSQIILK